MGEGGGRAVLFSGGQQANAARPLNGHTHTTWPMNQTAGRTDGRTIGRSVGRWAPSLLYSWLAGSVWAANKRGILAARARDARVHVLKERMDFGPVVNRHLPSADRLDIFERTGAFREREGAEIEDRASRRMRRGEERAEEAPRFGSSHKIVRFRLLRPSHRLTCLKGVLHAADRVLPADSRRSPFLPIQQDGLRELFAPPLTCSSIYSGNKNGSASLSIAAETQLTLPSLFFRNLPVRLRPAPPRPRALRVLAAG